jgi:hypothetical protein
LIITQKKQLIITGAKTKTTKVPIDDIQHDGPADAFAIQQEQSAFNGADTQGLAVG